MCCSRFHYNNIIIIKTLGLRFVLLNIQFYQKKLMTFKLVNYEFKKNHKQTRKWYLTVLYKLSTMTGSYGQVICCFFERWTSRFILLLLGFPYLKLILLLLNYIKTKFYPKKSISIDFKEWLYILGPLHMKIPALF